MPTLKPRSFERTERDWLLLGGQVDILAMIARDRPVTETLAAVVKLAETLEPAALAGVTIVDRAEQSLEMAVFPSVAKSWSRGRDRCRSRAIGESYLPAVPSWVDTVLNVFDSWPPRVLATAMMATEMPAAIRPYSIAVAPLSSRRKFL